MAVAYSCVNTLLVLALALPYKVLQAASLRVALWKAFIVQPVRCTYFGGAHRRCLARKCRSYLALNWSEIFGGLEFRRKTVIMKAPRVLMPR